MSREGEVRPLPDVSQIVFPSKYPFAAYGGMRFAPTLAAAREELRGLDFNLIRDQYAYGVLEHPKPTYLMLPVMMLVVADQLGGVGERHRAYLPWLMLAMELGATLDDTVDRNPMRAGRLTYSERFGEASASSFAMCLACTMSAGLLERVPEALPSVLAFFRNLSLLEVWEIHRRYPAVERHALARWNRVRSDANGPAIAMAIDVALILHGRSALPRTVYQPFSDLMQDVDDLVHIVEDREQSGELSDLRAGVVPAGLVDAIDADPELADLVERLWTPYRDVPSRARDAYRAGMAAQAKLDEPLYREVVARVRRHGVLPAVARIERDARRFVEGAPPELARCFEIAVTPWLERAQNLGAELRSAESHARGAEPLIAVNEAPPLSSVAS